MKIRAITLKSLLTGLVLLCGLAGNVQATTVALPRLDIVAFDGSDSGVTVGGGDMSIDATVVAIDIGGNSVPLSHEDFTLNATLNSGTGLYEGSLTAGSYLSADFTGLTFLDYSLGAGTSGAIYGSVTYTGGSLQGGYTGGDFDMEFSGATVAGVLGPVVVPVPAAVWLFGSGLIALASVARRK